MCCFRSEFAPGTHSSLPFTNQDQLSSKTTRDHVLEIHGLWLWVTLGCGKWSVHLCMWKVKYAGVELTHTHIRRISQVNPACFQESPDSKHHQTSSNIVNFLAHELPIVWCKRAMTLLHRNPSQHLATVNSNLGPRRLRCLAQDWWSELVWPDPQKNSWHMSLTKFTESSGSDIRWKSEMLWKYRYLKLGFVKFGPWALCTDVNRASFNFAS